MSKPRAKAAKVHKTTSQRAWESDEVRCFYCRSLLIVTDASFNYSVCSETCPSKLVVVTNSQKSLIRRAWTWEKSLGRVSSSASISKECNDVSVEDS